MDFIGVKELAQNLRKYVQEKDWVIVTVHGKPKKILKEISPDELSQAFQRRGGVGISPLPPLASLKACGMWKKDRARRRAVAWVRGLRRRQGLRYPHKTP